LCRFFLFFFLRLCVAIFLSFLFLPQGICALLRVAIGPVDNRHFCRAGRQDSSVIMHGEYGLVKAVRGDN